jgi:hypothetical protein
MAKTIRLTATGTISKKQPKQRNPNNGLIVIAGNEAIAAIIRILAIATLRSQCQLVN